ncbi:hypothetical protein HID58_047514 [Brassica napus]|uniref:GRF-type domain-containing protein n=1 Tax=Brassica napus TaxID=3708 RepID=A0ABQ8AZF2_BRANA|nr:hypothetical protein HID58_047514 [Brassica napus]
MDDVNLSQADDMDEDIGTQGLEGLSRSSYVPGFYPSRTNKDNEAHDWWTPMTTWERWCKGPSKKLELSDSPMTDDGSPQSLLYYFNEESWNRFTQWALNPTPLRIGHTAFNLIVAQRILIPGKWLENEEMDAMMYMWRENTTLRRWNIKRVAFMSALFCLQLDNATINFILTKKPTNCRIFFLLTGEESFCLMAELIKSGVLILIVSTFLCLDGITKQRGIFTRCNCGEAAALFTSKTVKNPGRLFHSCPMGSDKEKTHLFKWTDRSVVEEIEDFQELVDVLPIDNSQFQNSLTACETMLKRHESRIEEMEDVIGRCEEKTIECIRELRFIKSLFVFCLVMVFILEFVVLSVPTIFY